MSATRMGKRTPAGATALLGLMLTLGGCASLLGGSKEPTTIYAPDARVTPSPEWPRVDWRLTIGRTSGGRTADSARILVRPSPSEVQVYKGAQWASSPGDMLEDAVLHALEDSGRIDGVARQGTGLSAQYRLLLDVRRFESEYTGAATPAATVEVTAKLLHIRDQQLAGSRTFLRAEPAATSAVPDVVAAFERAMVAVTGELAGWTLATGEQYERARR